MVLGKIDLGLLSLFCRGGKRFGPSFKNRFQYSKFFFPNEERGTFHWQFPAVMNQVQELRFFDPKRVESEGDGAKIFVAQHLKQDGLMVRNTAWEDMQSKI